MDASPRRNDSDQSSWRDALEPPTVTDRLISGLLKSFADEHPDLSALTLRIIHVQLGIAKAAIKRTILKSAFSRMCSRRSLAQLPLERL